MKRLCRVSGETLNFGFFNSGETKRLGILEVGLKSAL